MTEAMEGARRSGWAPPSREEACWSVLDDACDLVASYLSAPPDGELPGLRALEAVDDAMAVLYRRAYRDGLCEAPGWSGLAPRPGDRLLVARRLRGIPDGEISWPALGRAVFGGGGPHGRREVVAELAALIDPGPGTFVGACPECGCPYDEGWSYCCACGEGLPGEYGD